ncbi:unnamed protein product [Tetraodon nigroviridis]|uniref:dTMP kinase n=1 Tax=Tetraodon nigroviridis TaxID=99883 RepID=Q4T979_TETNG|nr:unnamed protein product [Tetraodon nigroviridis]
MACKRGALIVLEGVDKAGKTTQCKKLVQALQERGQPAEMMRFPDRTTAIGQLISAYLENKSELTDQTVHLLFAANRWEMVPLIKKKLQQGTTLVVDRYAFLELPSPVPNQASAWSGASIPTWACQGRTSSCFYSSVPLRRRSEVSLVQKDTRPVPSKEQFSRSFNI